MGNEFLTVLLPCPVIAFQSVNRLLKTALPYDHCYMVGSLSRNVCCNVEWRVRFDPVGAEVVSRIIQQSFAKQGFHREDFLHL